MNKRVVIVGAGFVGTLTARRLREELGASTEIVLIDPKENFLFTPRLIDVLADPAFPRARVQKNLHELARKHGFTFLQGRVTAIDRQEKIVTYEPVSSSKKITLTSYDKLVLCQGAKPAFYNIPGAETHSLPLKTEEDVRHIHTRVEDLLRTAERTADENLRRQLLSFLIVGGGPSGIEALCALKLMVERTCRKKYPQLLALCSWQLVQAGPQILPGFPVSMVEGTIRYLEKQGVLLSIGEPVTEVEDNTVKTTAQTIHASLIVWCAGIEPSQIPIHPKLHQHPAGYLISDRFLQIAPHIFSAGDIIMYKESNMLIPKNAQTAMRMAPLVAKNVVRSLTERALIPFHYVSRGNLLLLGRSGFIQATRVSFQTRFTPWIRDMFYRFRFWQITRS